MDDLISRQATYDVLTEYYHHRMNTQHEALWDALKRVPSAQPDLQEYSVWFRIGETLVDVSKMHITAEEGIEKIRSYLMRMKKPERKKGEWIKMSDADGIYYCCSECGEELYRKWSFNIDYVLLPKKESIERTNFCPNCGADMRGEQDEY